MKKITENDLRYMIFEQMVVKELSNIGAAYITKDFSQWIYQHQKNPTGFILAFDTFLNDISRKSREKILQLLRKHKFIKIVHILKHSYKRKI